MNATRWARSVVADWTLLLVGRLPERVARDRFDEITSDLWEQQHDAEARDRRPLRIAASILLRAARGVPADLAWRWTEAHRPASATVTAPAAARAWVHLAGTGHSFDQTNGVVDFDVEDKHDASRTELSLLEKGAATSILSVGGLGLGG